jgi:Na+/H+-dicarboxylate symporter
MKLHWKILIGMALGVATGLLINPETAIPGLDFLARGARAALGPLVEPVGQIFVKLLKMLIVPLIVASMVTGVARVGDIRKLGGLGARTVAYYLTTTFAAVLVGLVLVVIVRPGVGGSAFGAQAPEGRRTPSRPRPRGRSCP